MTSDRGSSAGSDGESLDITGRQRNRLREVVIIMSMAVIGVIITLVISWFLAGNDVKQLDLGEQSKAEKSVGERDQALTDARTALQGIDELKRSVSQQGQRLTQVEEAIQKVTSEASQSKAQKSVGERDQALTDARTALQGIDELKRSVSQQGQRLTQVEEAIQKVTSEASQRSALPSENKNAANSRNEPGAAHEDLAVPELPTQRPGAQVSKTAVPLRSYVVQKGDVLSAITRKFCVSADEIKRLNPSIDDINKIGMGQNISLPQRDCPTAPPVQSKDSTGGMR